MEMYISGLSSREAVDLLIQKVVIFDEWKHNSNVEILAEQRVK